MLHFNVSRIILHNTQVTGIYSLLSAETQQARCNIFCRFQISIASSKYLNFHKCIIQLLIHSLLNMQRQTSVKQDYTKIKKMGEGTYGTVYKAIHNQTEAVVALKKIKFSEDDQGVPVTAIREISILQNCKHANIIELKQVFYDLDNLKLYLVLEFAPQSLHEILKQHSPLSPFLVKSYMYQLMIALHYLQTNRLIHRDLKPHNILVTDEGKIKLCDFGLARYYHIPNSTMTKEISTLWYRPPEILLGAKTYDISADMWAFGCILAEAAEGIPLFEGTSQIDQIFRILNTLGTPTLNEFPELAAMEHYKQSLPKFKERKLNLKHLDLDGMNLLNQMLQIDSRKRINVKQALNHPYFEGYSTDFI